MPRRRAIILHAAVPSNPSGPLSGDCGSCDPVSSPHLLRGYASRALRAAHRLYCGALRRFGRRSILLWPPFSDQETLTDIHNRMSFYLGARTTVWIPVTEQGLRPADGPLVSMPRYSRLFQARYFVNRHRAGFLLSKVLRHELILLWRTPNDPIGRFSARVLPHVRVIDPASCQYEAAAISAPPGRERRSRLEASRERFFAWYGSAEPKEKVYLLATGPSLSRVEEFDLSDGYVIACNSIAANLEVLEHASPDFLAAADPVFHFGPSRYAQAFRENLARTARRFGYRLVTVDTYSPVVTRHLRLPPESVFELPIRGDQRLLRLDRSWTVPSTANVLTLLMLPLAFTLARTILILGADGRRPDEHGFWEHARTPPLDDVSVTVHECHPAFFAKRDYSDYYRAHCNTLERQIETIERAGGVVRSLTPSFIPALQHRRARDFG